MRWSAVIAVICLVVAAPASGATKLVVTGHGWGHGVGMSQWGAYGFAKHGWRYDRILAHYYPGTQLSPASVANVRVQLAAAQPRVSVGCPGGLKVSDATGRTYSLRGGVYALNAKLSLPVGRKRVRQPHHEAITVPVKRALRSPLVFDCPSAPLTWNGRAYHGLLVVRRSGKRLSVVNSVDLEDYVRGVVAGEMPHNWSLAALESQAVAARTYALATLRPDKHFDLFSDTRSQVYGGVAYETPQTNFAIQRTAGKILTWHGLPASTFFFSTSGGRTADVRDVWPRLGNLPYLRSVSDPYDFGPHHSWRVVVPATKLPSGPFKVVHAQDGRVTRIVIGTHTIAAAAFRERFGLQSTWFDIGRVSLTAAAERVRFGKKIQLDADVEGLGRARLERRIGAGRWKPLATVAGQSRVTVEPRAHTLYRLDVGPGIAGPEVSIDVAPQLAVTPSGADVLAGSVEPQTRGAISVLRYVSGGWKVVAHPRLDAQGTFRAPLKLHAGEYRVEIGDDGRYANATADVHVTSRLLASFGY